MKKMIMLTLVLSIMMGAGALQVSAGSHRGRARVQSTTTSYTCPQGNDACVQNGACLEVCTGAGYGGGCCGR